MKIISRTPEITFDDVLLLPGKSNYAIREEETAINLKTHITKKLTIDVPIVSSPMPGITEEQMAIALGEAGGLGFVHCFQTYEKQLGQVVTTKKAKVKIAASIKEFDAASLRHVGALLKVGADLISIEWAHAYNTEIIDFVKKLKKKYPKMQLSVSLVVTPEATEALIKAGADNIRVGIGGGSHCTTRLVTGVGRPQLSTIQECYKVTKKYGIPLLSDTGIKYAGDIAKAIVFGADAVMIGGLFSGTDECPGEIVRQNGKKYKQTWGFSTAIAMLHDQEYSSSIKTKLKKQIKQLLGRSGMRPYLLEEGISNKVPYKGSVKPILRDLIAGTRRSMWYQGAKNLDDMRKNAQVVLVSPTTNLENQPRI